MRCSSAALALAVGAVAVLLALPYATDHPIPSNSLPPAPVWRAGFALLAFVDALLRALTPANLSLFRETMGYVHTIEIYSVAELRLADAIASAGVPLRDEGVPTAHLARFVAPTCESEAPGSAASCDAVALRVARLLRATSAYGVFAEAPRGKPDAWVNTAQSHFLRSDHPASLRPVVLNFGAVQFAMLARLPETVRSGASSFSLVHGAEMWDYYAAHPPAHAVFDATMNALGKLGAADAAIATGIEWGSVVDTLVDVGGGFGEMAATILTSASPPPRRGIVFDLDSVVARTRVAWGGVDAAAAGEEEVVSGDGSTLRRAEAAPVTLAALQRAHPDLSSRVSVHGGNMFDAATVPRGGSDERVGYLLRDILHDWSDEASISILSSLRAAMAPTRDRVFIVARVIVPRAGFIQSLGTADADMVMLGAFGTTAGERSIEHFQRLLAAAGLRLVGHTRTRSAYSIIEAAAAV